MSKVTEEMIEAGAAILSNFHDPTIDDECRDSAVKVFTAMTAAQDSDTVSDLEQLRAAFGVIDELWSNVLEKAHAGAVQASDTTMCGHCHRTWVPLKDSEHCPWCEQGAAASNAVQVDREDFKIMLSHTKAYAQNELFKRLSNDPLNVGCELTAFAVRMESLIEDKE